MGINATPVADNGILNIRGVKVELLATPTQTWDVEIRGNMYHITLEQEVSLLRATLYYKDCPSPSKIEQLSYSGKRRMPPSPALIAQMTTICHTCIDPVTNIKKSCTEVFGIKGYGYMSKWKAFIYCLPHAMAALIWGSLICLIWNVLKWMFTIDSGTPYCIPDNVSQWFYIIGGYVAVELCFKSGREYLKGWTNHRILWVIAAFYIGCVAIITFNRHRPYDEQDGSLAMAIILIITILASLLAMCIFAMYCYIFLSDTFSEGENLDTVDKYGI